MKILLIGAGLHHNDYSGVDGSSNFRYHFSIMVQSIFPTGTMLYYHNISKPFENKVVDNPILDALGFNKIKYLCTRQMHAIPIDYQEIYNVKPDIIFIEIRPNVASTRYLFAEEYRRLMGLIQDTELSSSRIVLFDFDNWVEYYPKDLKTYTNIISHHPGEFFIPMEPISINQKSNWKIIDNTITKYFDIVYIGNTYGRSDYLTMFNNLGELGYKVAMTGNWFRKSNLKMIEKMKHISFIGESPHWTTLPLLRMSKVSIIIGNDFQVEYGTLTFRICEAVEAGCPFIVHRDYDKFSKLFKSYPDYLKFTDEDDIHKILVDLENESNRKFAVIKGRVFLNFLKATKLEDLLNDEREIFENRG